jgi:hypothetical protein
MTLWGGEIALISTPITRPPSTASPCASMSASSAIPQPAARAASSAAARCHRAARASPVTDVAKANVAPEFPAPEDGEANVAATLKATAAAPKMINARVPPQARTAV